MILLGVTLALSYRSPEFEIFNFCQKLDENLMNAELRVNRTREAILNDTQESLRTLISAGQVYHQHTNLTEQFEIFFKNYEELNEFVERVIPAMNHTIERSNFSRIDDIINKLNESDQLLAREMLTYQQERVNYLVRLNELTISLSETLTDFEKMFYETERPSQPIFYFQNIVNIFEEIEKIHQKYTFSTESYYRAKTNYYLILVDMGLKEYFFGR